MDKVEKKYQFEQPNYKYDDSPLDRVVLLEQKFSRLTLWISVLTFLLVASVIGALVVQIVVNGKASTAEDTTSAALARHAQLQSGYGNTHGDMEPGTCCEDLAQKLKCVEERFQEALLQLKQYNIEVNEPPSHAHHAPPNSDVAHTHPEEGFVPPGISSDTFVETGIEYNYPDDLYDTGSGDGNIFIDSEVYDYDSREVSGSGMGTSISDDEDLTSVEGSACWPRARPVCPDGCVTDVMQDGCPVPVCCQAVPETSSNSHSSGHHHHH